MTWGQRTNAVVVSQASILYFIFTFCNGEVSKSVVLRKIWVVWRAWQAETCSERSSRVGKTAGLVSILAFSAPSPVKEKTIFFCPHRGLQLFLLPRPEARADLSEVYQTRPGNLYPPPAPREFRDPGEPASMRSKEQMGYWNRQSDISDTRMWSGEPYKGKFPPRASSGYSGQ